MCVQMSHAQRHCKYLDIEQQPPQSRWETDSKQYNQSRSHNLHHNWWTERREKVDMQLLQALSSSVSMHCTIR